MSIHENESKLLHLRILPHMCQDWACTNEGMKRYHIYRL